MRLIRECGCSLRSGWCEVGKRLLREVWAYYAEIEQRAFVRRPLHEREAMWQRYQQAVDAYLRHCGYVAEGNEVSAETQAYG